MTKIYAEKVSFYGNEMLQNLHILVLLSIEFRVQGKSRLARGDTCASVYAFNAIYEHCRCWPWHCKHSARLRKN